MLADVTNAVALALYALCSLIWVAWISCIDLIVWLSLPQFGTDTCLEWNVEFLALEFHGKSVDLAFQHCLCKVGFDALFCCWTCCKESSSLAWSGDWSVRAWFLIWYLLLILPLPLNCCLKCCLFLSLGDHLLAWHYHLVHSLWCICSPLFLVEIWSYFPA